MKKITHLGPRDFGNGAIRMASWSSRGRTAADGFVAVHTDYLKQWQDDIQNAFDLGFKAAGGSISPDNPPGWQLVEIAVTRDEIDALSDAIAVAMGTVSQDEEKYLSAVLEKVSFFVRQPRKPKL